VQGWEGEGLFGLQSSEDSFDNSAGVAEHIVVPEADYSPTFAFEPGRPRRIRRVVRVLTSIDLDH